MSLRRVAVPIFVALVVAGCGGGAKRDALPHSGPVPWSEAKRLLLECQVTRAEVVHSGLITLDLENGARVTSHEPHVNAVTSVMREVDPHCTTLKTFAQE